RGRGRTRRAAGEAAPSRSRSRSRVAAEPAEGGEPTLVALPGEKLSRVAAAPAEAPSEGDIDEAPEDAVAAIGDETVGDGAAEEARRRRRRRGGRGRGRGRAREEGFGDEAGPPAAAAAGDDEEAEEESPAPARRAASAFGSVWDSQIGISASRGAAPVLPDDEDYEEPAVPEYLLAERRQRDGGR